MTASYLPNHIYSDISHITKSRKAYNNNYQAKKNIQSDQYTSSGPLQYSRSSARHYQGMPPGFWQLMHSLENMFDLPQHYHHRPYHHECYGHIPRPPMQPPIEPPVPPLPPTPPTPPPSGINLSGIGPSNIIQGNLGQNALVNMADKTASIINNIQGSVSANLSGGFAGNLNAVGDVTVRGVGNNDPVTLLAHAHSAQNPSLDIRLPAGDHRVIAIGGSGTVEGARFVNISPTRGGQTFRINGAEEVKITTAIFTLNGRPVDNTGLRQIADNTWIDGSGNRYILDNNVIPQEHFVGNTSPANLDINTNIFPGGNGIVTQDGRPSHPTTITVAGQQIHAPEVTENTSLV